MIFQLKQKNQKESTEINKTSFSYSDKLKAPPQKHSSNFFKFEKEVNDFNKNECSSHQPQLPIPKNNFSQNKHNIKKQFQSNSDMSKVKQVPKASGTNNFAPDIQTGPDTGRNQLHNKCSQQENVNNSSSVDMSQESSAEADGWTVYHKHSSTKHMHEKYRSNHERGFKGDCKDAEQESETYHRYEEFGNSTGQNQSSKHVVSKAFNTTSAKVGRSKLDIHREVPYTNDAKLNNTTNKSRSNMNPKVNHVSSSTTPNEMLKQVSHNEQQRHNTNKIHDVSRNDYPGTSWGQIRPNSDHKISGHPNEGQYSEQTSRDSTATKAKKKRKSKIKRQAALQTGKIVILTPEAHSKILNQANSTGVKSQSIAATNINDDEEYPELGIGIIPKSNKENPLRTCEVDLKVKLSSGLQVENDEASASQLSINNDLIKSTGLEVNAEKVINSEAGLTNFPVHSSNQITVSLFDMLSTKKPKKKEVEDKILEEETHVEHSPVKVRTKKVVSQPVNPLASSKPTVKRGKEREQPKPKKPSKMRKLIMIGRKIKQENIQLKDNELHINNQSDSDADALSDGSTLSPSKSPVSGEAYFSHKTNSFVTDIDLLEDKMPVSTSSCKKLFSEDEFQERKSHSHPTQPKDAEIDYSKATLYDVTDKLDPQIQELNEYKIFVSNVENENNGICSNTFEEQKAGLVENTLSLDLNNPKENLEFNAIQESCFFENDRVQTIEYEDQTSFKNMTLDLYYTTLVQSIFDDCMMEMRSRLSEVSTEKKPEIMNTKVDEMSEDITRDISQLKIPIHLKNKIDTNSNISAQSILGACLSEGKVLQNENAFSLVLSDKSTSAGSSVSGHYFSLAEDIVLLSKITKSNIEEFSLKNSCDTNSTDRSEKPGKVMDTKDVSSCTLNCSNVINSESELKISDVNLEPLSQSLQKSAVQVNMEPPQSKFSDQEKVEAAKILLHTRRFRDYCSHFITKDLDMTVFTLLDDLARFQDRMHQKDPVKARAKRRLMYGIKEIKKHLTLKKLKGIIIATDIEDNKTEGGLNDLLKELISLSEAYHIPYVFSHKRFNLGKVCRKPAPVSCVGILNYEGSEKNFKKMLELQEENQRDYTVITKKIVELLTDDHIQSLFETVQKSIIPYEISKLIMKELFGNDLLGDEIINLEVNVKPEITNLKLDTKALYPVLKPEFSASDKNCKLIEDDFEKYKIHTILKKYNVIKT